MGWATGGHDNSGKAALLGGLVVLVLFVLPTALASKLAIEAVEKKKREESEK